MMPKYRAVTCILGKYMLNNMPVMMGRINYQIDNSQSVRCIAKHWNQKYRRHRARKVYKVDLSPERLSPNMSSDIDAFQTLKKRGYVPLTVDCENSMSFFSLGSLIEPYEPPVGDGKFSSLLTQERLKKAVDINHARKNFVCIRRVKSFIIDFKTSTFLDEAVDIYVKAHEALANKDYETLSEYVTEFGFVNMTEGLKNKTVSWKLLEILETPKLVQARMGNLLGDTDNYTQLTVRLHTQQILCIYDRFGRRIQGSEILKKDVLEYVVFERHLSNQYGAWRIFTKIFPKNYVCQDTYKNTYVIPKKSAEEEDIAARTEKVSQATASKQ